MKLTFPITLPQQIKISRLRKARVVALQCVYCHQWLKPRYIRLPACVCRRCEAAGANQTWKPSAAHLARAYADVAREEAARNGRPARHHHCREAADGHPHSTQFGRCPMKTTTPPAGKRVGRGESIVQVLIMIAVAGMAGAASFTHVHDWTMHNSPAGTGNWFGWANAMVSELIPLAAGLEARRRIRLFGTAGIYPIALIIAAVALSLTGQFAEATPSASGRLIAAVPALGFLALVKLVLSSPAAPTAPAEPAVTTPTTMAAPSAAIVPAVVIDPIPNHLLASARFAAANHAQHNRHPITVAEELAARLSVPDTTAAALLRHLTADTVSAAPAVVNGHDLTVGVR